MRHLFAMVAFATAVVLWCAPLTSALGADADAALGRAGSAYGDPAQWAKLYPVPERPPLEARG